MPAVSEERTNTDIFTPDAGVQVDPGSLSSPSSDVVETIAAGESVPSGQLGAHMVEAELVVVWEVSQVQGQSSCGEERLKSSIAKRGKRNCGNVYTSQKRSKKHGGVSAAQVAGTDSDVGGAPPGKLDDESPLVSSGNANVEPNVRPMADEGFPTGQLWVDDVDGSVHVRMVAEEGTAEDAEGTAVSGDAKVDYVHNSIDQGGDGGRKSPCDVVVDASVVVTDEKFDKGMAMEGPDVPTQSEKGATYDDPIVAGVDAVRCDTHGTEAENSAGPSTQTSAVIEGTVDKGRDGRGNPSPVAVVVTMSDKDNLPTSSEAGRGRQSPQQHPRHAGNFTSLKALV
ncbi:LOW QUALITY PROTEIN: hypothetical protein Cgig2_030429 [Carnegiea gigantea]|uniref:Uncharacterized protein n=1 Tax=Carnegiea gigantea TaxID=171969 RepID=A0A9Q1KQT0_9CARY|nr:LOW QUALITY PROTEIN: hypothetical protein Cgig2_030429 [Carnegiea gigantea]